jgi:long-chain acyl-CoA synthetase
MQYAVEVYDGKQKRYKVEGIGEETINGVPTDVYLNRPRTLPELFHLAVQKDPRHEVLVYGGRRILYADLARMVDNVAFQWKEEYGIGKTDRILILLRNTPEFVISFLAASQIGAISVPTNTRFKAPEIDYIVKDCRPSLIVAEPEIWERILPIRDGMKSLKAVFLTAPDPLPGALRFGDLLARPAPHPIRVESSEEDVNSILYTSGTTGNPKGAMLCHRNFIANSLNCLSLSPVFSSDRLLIMAPLFHVTALNAQLIKIIHAGATAALMRAFKTEDILDTIEREKITEMTGVPAMYAMLLQSPTLARRALTSLRTCGYGGAPAPVELIKTLREKFPAWRLRNVYGLTEASSWVTMLPHEEMTRRPESVGLPVPVVRLRIVDDRDQDLPSGQVGEILIRGSNVFKGYWEKSEATAESMKKGWFHTGDLGRLDEAGYLTLVDRKKDMVIRGGENIYCIEVENVLYQHPRIRDAAVSGEPDPIYGEVVKAAVVLKKGGGASEGEIQEFCKKYLANFKVPQKIRFVDALPKNAAGKVLKKELKKL